MKLMIVLLIIIVVAVITIFIAKTTQTNSQKIFSEKVTAKIADTQGIFNASYPAPELTGITAWLNPAKPFTLKSLRGKVVLVDFWTNQCINCIHTLPYVTKWYDTYKDQGFIVVGVHTPELESEYATSSIQNAIQLYGIHYPVAQDNNYDTWNAYKNEYWPAEYLIDKKGNVRRTYFGEGEYDKTELAIQSLLKE